MKAARIHSFGPPAPGPGEFLLRVMAAGVAPCDVLIGEGKSTVSPQPPLTLGSDLAGVVEEVGPEVSDFAPADEVYVVTNPQFCGAQAGLAMATVAWSPTNRNR
jgi:NADPH:quinone reductase-like Zn-dependent oxidoreductase